jgi:hypothetical protein
MDPVMRKFYKHHDEQTVYRRCAKGIRWADKYGNDEDQIMRSGGGFASFINKYCIVGSKDEEDT